VAGVPDRRRARSIFEFERELAYRKRVAVPQHVLFNALPVHERAVGAVQIDERKSLAVPFDYCVLTRDLARLKHDVVAIGSAPNVGLVSSEIELKRVPGF
jgi:hypothetical protein